jgi:hypothetical protein
MGVSPRQDLLLGKCSQVLRVPHPASVMEQPGEGIASWQPAAPALKRPIDSPPRFVRRLLHTSRAMCGPLAGAPKVRVRPGQDPRLREPRERQAIGDAAMLGEQTSKRRAVRQSAAALAQRAVNGLPGVTRTCCDWPRMEDRPRARTCVMLIGPAQNLRDVKIRIENLTGYGPMQPSVPLAAPPDRELTRLRGAIARMVPGCRDGRILSIRFHL